MANFNVTVPCNCVVTYTVGAESPEAAIRAVIDQGLTWEDGVVTVGDSDDIEDWEADQLDG
jgi:hypothetical protein